jgi:hypothetical protein
MSIQIDIFGGYNRSNPQELDPRELMNLYVKSSGGNSCLLNTAGLSISNGKKILGNGSVRALFASIDGNVMHAVLGNSIYQLDKTLNQSFGISLTTNKGYIGIAENSYQILFIDGVSGVVYDKTTNIYSKINSTGFPPEATGCAYIAGRFIVFTETAWYYSNINDATDWDLNNRYLPDPSDIVTGISVLNNRLYVFARSHAEIWYPTTTSLNPFEKDTSAAIDFGCISTSSISNDNGMLVWVGRGKKNAKFVFLMSSSTAEKISNDAIENKIMSYSNPEDVTSFIYTTNGCIFYQINFTADNESFLYNFNNKTWSKLTSNAFDRHRVNCYEFFDNKHYGGDYEKLNIYEFDTKYFSDEIEAEEVLTIRRQIITNRIYFNNKGLGYCIDRLQVIALQGTAKIADRDSFPVLECSLSADGGRTYGSVIVSQFGEIGVTDWQTDFYGLGTMFSTVIKLEFYYRINFALFSLNAFIRGAGQ